MLGQGASSSPIFAEHSYVFGMIPPASSFLDKALELLAAQGASSILGIMEAASFPRSACGAIESLSVRHSLDDRGNVEVSRNPSVDELLPLAKTLAVDTPDIIVGCMCVRGEASARKSPKESSVAEAGCVGGWRGHERSDRNKGVSDCGGSGQRRLGVVGGRPPEPPLRLARSHMREAAHARGRTCARREVAHALGCTRAPPTNCSFALASLAGTSRVALPGRRP
jgi:hypothetical protein